MKKSIKKACAYALLATSMTSVASAGAVLLVDNKAVNNNTIVFADEIQQSDRKVLSVEGSKTKATVGDYFTVPTAKFNNITLTEDNYTVKSPNGATVTVESGKFKVSTTGTYIITYSYEENDKTYTANYYVEGEVAKITINVKENTKRTLPGDVYESFTGDIYIPEVEVLDEDGEEMSADDYNVVTQVSTKSGELTFNEDGKLDLSTVKTNNKLTVGKYFVKYTVSTKSGTYLATLEKEFEVLSDKAFIAKYKKLDYTLSCEFSSTAPTSAEIGKELTLPKVTGKINSEQTPVWYKTEIKLVKDGKEIDVTDQTLEDGKFTAKKSYTINGTTYDATNATYQFYYNVTDALGKSGDKIGFSISGVKDTTAPEIMVVDAYDVDSLNEETVESAEYKLQQNFEKGENVILKAIYAKDLSDSLKDMTLTRTINKDNASSSESKVWSDEEYSKGDGAVENSFSKDIVFNKSESYNLGENEIDGGTLEAGSYTIYYKATDSAGKSVSVNYSFTVNANFTFSETNKPKIEFLNNFQESMSSGEKVSFSAPTVSAEGDSYLKTIVLYKFDNDTNWTTLELNDNSKYEFKLNKDGAKSVQIRAVAVGDAPMTNAEDNGNIIYANDISTYGGFKYGFAESTINIVDNQDSQVPEIVSIEKMNATYQQNTTITIPSLTISDDLVNFVNVSISATVKVGDETQDVDVENGTIIRAGNTYTITGATFDATVAGEYEIIYQVTDAGNNQLNIYQYTEVTANPIVKEPKFSNLPSTLNDGTLELGESIELPVPTLPDDESSDKIYEYSVDYKGLSGAEINKNKFTPKKLGTYTVIYKLYNKNYLADVLDTKEFTVTVQDTTKPEIYVVWNVNPSYEKGAKVLLPVFSASDASKIDTEKSKMTITSKSSATKTYKYSELSSKIEKDEYNNEGIYYTFNYNEEYTVTYTAYDVKGNVSTETHTVKVGDLVNPVIELADDIVPTTAKVGDKLSIDLSKITVSDDQDTDDSKISTDDIEIVVKNGSTTISNIHSDDDHAFEYEISSAGSYTVTFTIKDKAGNETSVTRTFTVSDSENNGSVDGAEVVAIVACCLAVLILAGAVVYMIITKKKIKSYK